MRRGQLWHFVSALWGLFFMPRATTKAASLADGPTLASTRDYWILHLRSEGKSERTISTYLRALDRLDAFLVGRGMPRALGAIRREHLEASFVALGELGNAPATISILFRALRPFWRWLVEEDEIERTPMERMRAPSVPLNPPPVLSDDQSVLLLAACRGTDLIARRDLAIPGRRACSAGHSEGDVMQLGGWTDRSMLSRYGASAAAERARAAYRSPIDRIGRQR
ncbi:MAG: tyrosine-type recombinase/integrase [Candidatus Limnocylindrales bacterium]